MQVLSSCERRLQRAISAFSAFMQRIAPAPDVTIQPQHEGWRMATNQTATQPVTAQELHQLPSGRRYTLIKGQLGTMPPAGGEHGSIAMHLGASLYQAVTAQNLGRVYAAETRFLLDTNPDTVLA